MNYGFTMGAAGVIAAMHRQDVASNNLANIQTTGFKPDMSFTIPRRAARQEDGLMNLPSNALLERLGAGVLLAPNRTSFTQGSIATSRNPFDLAIKGDGFLSVAGTDGSPRLTRDGRLMLDAGGHLVTVADGHDVLDDAGNPIVLNPAADFNVGTDGSIAQSGQVVAQLSFVDVPNRDALIKSGNSSFTLPPAPPGSGARASTAPATGKILQYSTEESSADPIQAMMAVQAAADAVTTTTKIMQIQDDMLNRAINTLGRITG